jgi:hypothetical protein
VALPTRQKERLRLYVLRLSLNAQDDTYLGVTEKLLNNLGGLRPSPAEA